MEDVGVRSSFAEQHVMIRMLRYINVLYFLGRQWSQRVTSLCTYQAADCNKAKLTFNGRHDACENDILAGGQKLHV